MTTYIHSNNQINPLLTDAIQRFSQGVSINYNNRFICCFVQHPNHKIQIDAFVKGREYRVKETVLEIDTHLSQERLFTQAGLVQHAIQQNFFFFPAQVFIKWSFTTHNSITENPYTQQSCFNQEQINCIYSIMKQQLSEESYLDLVTSFFLS